jgi:hypothetical protein
MDSDIFSYKEIFSILMFILVIIMVTEKSSPSYAVLLTYNQLNSGHMYGDDNAFSNLSRNMTFSAASGNITSPTNSIGPNFTVGDINRDNNFGHFGRNGMGDYDIRSGSIFTQHGPSSWWPHIWMHHFH